MKSKWLYETIAILMWIGFLALGYWLVLLLRTDIQAVMLAVYVRDNIWRAKEAGFADKIVLAALVCIWITTGAFIEEYYRSGIKNKKILERIAKVSGITLLVTFVADLIAVLTIDQTRADLSRWLFIVLELAAGSGFIWGWRYLHAKSKIPSQPIRNETNQLTPVG
ncbi:MAG TPA: hypothetical protein VIO61_07235 [Anaerolineaceae bacterium]